MQKKKPLADGQRIPTQNIAIEFTTVNASKDIDTLKKEISSKTLYPFLVLQEMVVLPELPQPIRLEDEEMVEMAKAMQEQMTPFFASTIKFTPVGKLKKSDFMEFGVVGVFTKVFSIPDGSSIGLFLPMSRAKLMGIIEKGDTLSAKVTILPPLSTKIRNQKMRDESITLGSVANEVFAEGLKFVPDEDRDRIMSMVDEFKDDPLLRMYSMIIHSPLDLRERMGVADAPTFIELQELFIGTMRLAVQRIQLHANITMRTQENLSKQQKEMFLRNQIRTIEEELGEGDFENEIQELEKRAQEMKWNDEAARHFSREIKKLNHFNPQSPDYSVQYTYLNTLLSLPWDQYSNKDIPMAKIEKILERDHYGLEDVKERILENMAVMKLRNDMKAPILCLAGPPGIGKTSLGKSIAEACGREYKRISFGGVHDEAEIRGHRRTYIGAMPGRVMEALTKCKTNDPVIVLDEVDKIGKDHKGDPSTALLELLDPEQNFAFHDNYIDVGYDLSKVMFIATANNLGDISRPLLDRMEVIELSGYLPEEKQEIAMRHLVKKCLRENGLDKKGIKFNKAAIDYIISHYTHESGVRQLEKRISKILRKIARIISSGKEYPKNITPKEVKVFLGKENLEPTIYENNDFSGVATGLAWTSAGGDMLFIETSISKGQNEKLTLTGNLGDVMKESATIALQYVKSISDLLNIPRESFNTANVHIHVPEGAIPKDGPSAGITMVTSIASAFTGRKIREKLAMTGEISLRGKILPVGGIKEKVLAAKRGGITDIILPRANEKDVLEIKKEYLKGVNFHYFERIEEALAFALLTDFATHRLSL